MPREKQTDLKEVEEVDLYTPQMIRSTVRDFSLFYIRNRDAINTKKNPKFDRFIVKEKAGIFRRHEEEVVVFPEEPVKRNEEEDERFASLNDLVRKYVGAMKCEPEEKENVEQSLWDLIVLLNIEKRINGDFEIQPYRYREISAIKAKYKILEGRVDIANDLAQRFWNEWKEYKASLPKGKLPDGK